MTVGNHFFEVLGIKKYTKKQLEEFALNVQLPYSLLVYYDVNHLLPPLKQLNRIASYIGMAPIDIMIRMGIYSERLKSLLSSNWNSSSLHEIQVPTPELISPELVHENESGKLYQGDCLGLLSEMSDSSVDVVFADPPFNLNKTYQSEMNDNIPSNEYISWSEDWLDECIRVLKPGGSFFLWNLPKWNTYLSEFLNHRLTFRHWIATDIKYTLPIASRLYPSHYSLLYYVKGNKANTFTPDRLRMETCSHCFKELRDYGGYKNKMNPLGINMTDVWYDIPPVRHVKHKKRKEANELSVKLLDRIIQMSSKEGDVIFDPFGGAGTTYVVAELKKRKWIGIELGPTDGIIERLKNKDEEGKTIDKYRANYNSLFPEMIKNQRIKRGIWTTETFADNLQKHSEQGVKDTQLLINL